MAEQTPANPSTRVPVASARLAPTFAASTRLAASGRAELAPRAPNAVSQPSLLDEPMLELELALSHFDRSRSFVDTVREAARDAGAEFLFELPASGMLDDCRQLAVLRIPSSTAQTVVLACLDLDGETIRLEAVDERTRHLEEFADAFTLLMKKL